MNRTGKWLAVVAVAMVNWLPIAGTAADRGFGPQTAKTNMNGLDDARLPAYLHGEAKYHVLPVPTPLDRATALAFVVKELPQVHSSEEALKLSRLTVFYDLRETADSFNALGKFTEREPHEVARTAAAIIAVAWVGDAEQFAKAQANFAALLGRAEIEPHRHTLHDANYALGPREGTDRLKQALASAVARLRASHAELAKKGRSPELDMLENRVARLNEFVGLEVANLDRANKLRAVLEGLPDDDARVPRLIELYLDDAPDSTPQLADWAGLRLLRVPTREQIAPGFLTQTRRYEKRDPARQPELDAVRARALRAAEFFGARLADADQQWLARQKDAGTDLLALRPNWQYPAPHAH